MKTIKTIALLLIIASTMSCEKVNLCGEKGTLVVTNKSLHTVQIIIINGINYGTIDPEEEQEIQLSEGVYQTGDNITFNFTEVGLYPIEYLVESENGCAHDTIINLSVQTIPDVGIIAQNACAGMPVYTTNSTDTISFQMDAYTVLYGDSTQGVSPTDTHYYQHPGIYEITIIGTSSAGCVNSENTTVEVDQVFASLSLDDTLFCPNTDIELIGSSLSVGTTPVSYWEFFDNENTSFIGDSIHVISYPNESISDTLAYNLGLIIENEIGCRDTIANAVSLTILPAPIAQFTTEIDEGEELTSLINISALNLSSGAENFYWNFGDGQTSELENPVFNYLEHGSYQIELIAEDAHGCQDTVINEIDIQPINSIFIPSGITPGGDNLNEEWKVFFHGLEFHTFNMSVYNRWGNIIFETKDPFFSWSPKRSNKSELIQEEVYTYVLKYQRRDQISRDEFLGKEEMITGTITVIR